MQAIHSETIAHEGRRFLVTLHHDDSSETPWDSEDGHVCGIRSLNRGEQPARGETFLCNEPDGRDTWVYHFGDSLVRASREGWGRPGPDTREGRRLEDLERRTGRKATRGQVRAAAVREDASHMAGFIRGDWCYVGVCVRILGADDEPIGNEFTHALWRVDYGHPCNPEYWREVAEELASEILSERSRAWRAALAERRAARYWATRGVQTVGV